MARLSKKEFRHLQETWDALGAEDPLWAVLSDPAARGNRWNPDEFFATGRVEIDRLYEHLAGHGVEVRPGRALDFGCGVGRLTQALAARFDRVDGVDIAPSMVAAARRFNRHGDRCTYHVNEKADLSLFDDGVFDFIYSRITLQHIPPEFTKRYLVEFARVLGPGGVAVLHVPTGMTPLRGTVFRVAMTKRRLLRRLGSVRRSSEAVKHDMYFVPRRTVADLLENHGLTLVATEESVTGSVHDVLYVVSRRRGRPSA